MANGVTPDVLVEIELQQPTGYFYTEFLDGKLILTN
jgi:hypothetical protein